MSRAYASGQGVVNTAVSLLVPARTGYYIKLTACVVSYDAAPTGGRLQVQGSTSAWSWDIDITGAGALAIPMGVEGIDFDPNESVTLTLAAGGAAVHGKINAGVDYCKVAGAR